MQPNSTAKDLHITSRL